MVTDLCGKRILFFSPAFFNYEYMIKDKLQEMGAKVDMYDVRSVKSAFSRAVLKIAPALFNVFSRKYYESIIYENKGKEYDYILIVKCDMTPSKILEKIRVFFPKAKLCLYLWDSVANISGVTKKFKYFDTISSFDPMDCERYSELKFRPLFFGDLYSKETKRRDYKYDISFLGTLHSDRYSVIKQVDELATKEGLECYWFLYLQSKFIYYLYRLFKKGFKKVDKRILSFEKMSAKDVAVALEESRIILDVQHPNQMGLTMRTIEMIGMHKKLITTNNSIRQYDFYNENNVAIIDRNKVEIPKEFLSGSYYEIPQSIYEKYTLKYWILDVLS